MYELQNDQLRETQVGDDELMFHVRFVIDDYYMVTSCDTLPMLPKDLWYLRAVSLIIEPQRPHRIFSSFTASEAPYILDTAVNSKEIINGLFR